MWCFTQLVQIKWLVETGNQEVEQKTKCQTERYFSCISDLLQTAQIQKTTYNFTIPYWTLHWLHCLYLSLNPLNPPGSLLNTKCIHCLSSAISQFYVHNTIVPRTLMCISLTMRKVIADSHYAPGQLTPVGGGGGHRCTWASQAAECNNALFSAAS